MYFLTKLGCGGNVIQTKNRSADVLRALLFRGYFANNLLIGGGNTSQNRTIFDTTRAFASH